MSNNDQSNNDQSNNDHSEEEQIERHIKWRDKKRRETKLGIFDWLDEVAEDIDEEDVYNADAPPWSREPKGVDRYRAWQDFYDMRKLPSGRWETTCRRCGTSYV